MKKTQSSEALVKFLEKETIDNVFTLREIAKRLSPRLKKKTPESVGTVIWTTGRIPDHVEAAVAMGRIKAAFTLIEEFELVISREVRSLREWGDVWG